MCIFPSFPSRIHVAVAELIVYGMDCIARVVADKPGGKSIQKPNLSLHALSLEASDRTPVAGAAHFHLMEVFSSSLLLHQVYDRRVPLSMHNYMIC
jgi:hypothetical protein